MTTRAAVQRAFDNLAIAATAHSLDPSPANGKALLKLLQDLEKKLEAVGEQATAIAAAETYKIGQTLGHANDDLGRYLNNGAIDAMQRMFDSLAGR